jgi:hypothetical protein
LPWHIAQPRFLDGNLSWPSLREELDSAHGAGRVKLTSKPFVIVRSVERKFTTGLEPSRRAMMIDRAPCFSMKPKIWVAIAALLRTSPVEVDQSRISRGLLFVSHDDANGDLGGALSVRAIERDRGRRPPAHAALGFLL